MAEIKLIATGFILIFMALLAGCTSSKDESIIPGYWSPGDLRPKGIAPEKAYNFQDLGADPRSCSGIDCRVVYGLWPHGTSYSQNVILGGFALDDSHILSASVTSLTFIVKVIDFAGIWSIYMIKDGVEYRGSATGGDVTITDVTSSAYRYPACSPPLCAETFEQSADQLKLKRMVFNNDITLDPTVFLTPTTTPSISIKSGDYIEAQAFAL